MERQAKDTRRGKRETVEIEIVLLHECDSHTSLKRGVNETGRTGVLDKAKVRSREASEIGENFRKIAAIDAKPGCECGEELVACSRGNPSPGAGIVWPAHSQRRERSIGLLAMNRAAHDHVMTAPAVIAALAVARESPAEVARGEGRDALAEVGIIVGRQVANLVHRGLESVHALAEFSEKIRVGAVEH